MTALAFGEARAADREFHFTDADFHRIAARLYADSGIHLAPAKAGLVYSRLGKRLRQLGLSGFDAYCARLEGPDGDQEARVLLSALTTNVTRFFREPHHFDALRRQVRDGLAETARSGGRVRLWSAGCSNGHEPWSMAMSLMAELPEATELDVRILATDIDPEVVARAREGLYSAEDIAPVPAELAKRFLVHDGERYGIAESVRRLVRFGVLNLHADWPMTGRFDAVFCRNVAIYFDDHTQARLWSRLAERLTAQGCLYIGHSERIDDPTLRLDGLTCYRRRGA